MAIKIICSDSADNTHLLLGLNRSEINALLEGKQFRFPPGVLPLNEHSEVVIMFAETDDELEKRMPQKPPPAS